MTAPAQIAAAEDVRLHADGNFSTGFLLANDPENDALPSVSAGGLAELRAGGALRLFADVEAGSLNLEAGADASLFGAFNATAGGLDITTGGNLTFVATETGAYENDTRDSLALRANGDINIASGGAIGALYYDRSWQRCRKAAAKRRARP